MQHLKDKIFDYESTPPAVNWEKIALALDGNTGVTRVTAKRNILFYFTAAACALIAVLAIAFYFTGPSKKTYDIAGKQPRGYMANDKENSALVEDKITVPETTSENDDITASGNGTTTVSAAKKYITITGPGGQPVKISPKAAMLIAALNDQNPMNPVWNDQIKKWKSIMMANVLVPTPTNFLDIVDLTQVLRVGNR